MRRAEMDDVRPFPLEQLVKALVRGASKAGAEILRPFQSAVRSGNQMGVLALTERQGVHLRNPAAADDSSS